MQLTSEGPSQFRHFALLPSSLTKHLHTFFSCYFGCQCPTELSPHPYSGPVYLTLSMPPLPSSLLPICGLYSRQAQSLLPAYEEVSVHNVSFIYNFLPSIFFFLDEKSKTPKKLNDFPEVVLQSDWARFKPISILKTVLSFFSDKCLFQNQINIEWNPQMETQITFV